MASTGGDGYWQSNLPIFTRRDEDEESRTLTHEERLLAFADVYGRKPPAEMERDRHLEAFDREMSRLPTRLKSALHRGFTVKQARLFLFIEDNDARRAARRMARFWDERFKQFGEAAFSQENTPHRTQEDFRHVYEMALKALLDPEVDEETKRWAINYANEWKRGNLLLLEEELETMPDHEKAALLEAQRTRPDIAASDDHKLLFLRCEDFDAQRACRRLVKYWDLKFDLFGREGAFRSVTANDLMRDHSLELSVGFFWSARGTDSFGRGIIYFVPGKVFETLMQEQGCTEEGLLKVAWYLGHAVLEEEKSCRENGFVVIFDDRKTDSSNFNPEFASKLKSMYLESLPFKFKSHHIFPPQFLSYFKTFLPFYKWLIGKKQRMRLWVHTGSEEESLSELEDCGISRDLIPTTLGGKLDIDRLGMAWLIQRQEAGL